MLVVTIIFSKREKCFFLHFILYFFLLCAFWIYLLCTGFFFPLNFLNILPKGIPTKIPSWNLLLLIQAGFILFNNQNIETGMSVKYFFFNLKCLSFDLEATDRSEKPNDIPKPFWKSLFYMRAQVPHETLCLRLRVHKCSYNSSCRIKAIDSNFLRREVFCLCCF